MVRILAIGLALAGCGASSQATTRAQVTVVMRGDDAPVADVVSRANLPVKLRLVEPAAAPESEEVPLDLSATRRAYDEGQLEACFAGLGDETDVDQRLAMAQPEAAARLLFWRTTCEVLMGDLSAAERTAQKLATLGLSVPADVVDDAHVEVEALLARAQRAVTERARAAVRFVSEPPAAVVTLDGSVGVCRTPCTVDVAPGRHVFVLGRDGYADERGSVEAGESPAEVSVALRTATPDVAARQWLDRGRSRASLDDPVSMSVLATAVRAQRLLLLESERDGDTRSVHAALFVDGALSARSERIVSESAALESEIDGLITDVLERGEVLRTVPIYQQPVFWITLLGVVAIAAGISAALIYEPDVRYQVEFAP